MIEALVDATTGCIDYDTTRDFKNVLYSMTKLTSETQQAAKLRHRPPPMNTPEYYRDVYEQGLMDPPQKCSLRA